MPKFFVPKQNVLKDSIIINSEDAAHITKVLRYRPGDILELCDGSGTDYSAEIESAGKDKISCRILSKTRSVTEANIEITLFQGLPKASKMEYIIQKNTELGVRRIVPCIMSRCVVKLDKNAEKKTERWRRIAYEAAKQSGRGVVPEVTEPVMFDDALVMLKRNDIFFAPYECENKNTLKHVLTSKEEPRTVGFMIGPEGGYDLNEVEKLKKSGIDTVTLGKRIMRTETAGEAVTAMVMYEIGDVNLTERCFAEAVDKLVDSEK